MAGLVTYRKGSEIKHTLVNFDRKPLLCIPNLAIHLNRDGKTEVNVEEHLHPIFTTEKKNEIEKCDNKGNIPFSTMFTCF